MQVKTNLAPYVPVNDNIEQIILDPLPSYQNKQYYGYWLYEGSSPPFHKSIPQAKAQDLCPHRIPKNQNCIVRDSDGNLIMAVYRNCMGPQALQLMNETVTETLYYRRPVARESLPSSIKQGHLTATGYVVHRGTGIFCHARNIRNQYRSSTSEISAHEEHISAAMGLLWNCARTFLPAEVIASFEKARQESGLPGQDGALYGTEHDFFEYEYKGTKLRWNRPLGACQSYASENYTRHVHTDDTAITHPFVLISRRGILNSDGQFVEKDFVGGNFYLLKWGILVEYDSGTLFAFPDAEEHGTTVISPEGYQIGWSQHISQRIVAAYRNWIEGKDTEQKQKKRKLFIGDAPEKTQKAFEKKNEEVYNTGILTEKELYSTENTDLEIIRNDDSYCYIVQKTYNLRPKTKK